MKWIENWQKIEPFCSQMGRVHIPMKIGIFTAKWNKNENNKKKENFLIHFSLLPVNSEYRHQHWNSSLVRSLMNEKAEKKNIQNNNNNNKTHKFMTWATRKHAKNVMIMCTRMCVCVFARNTAVFRIPIFFASLAIYRIQTIHTCSPLSKNSFTSNPPNFCCCFYVLHIYSVDTRNENANQTQILLIIRCILWFKMLLRNFTGKPFGIN